MARFEAELPRKCKAACEQEAGCRNVRWSPELKPPAPNCQLRNGQLTGNEETIQHIPKELWYLSA